MSELLTKLGIDWKLLIAQIVNFLVLLFVLWKFAYGPILAMLEKRQKKIEKGLADAEEAGRKLSESEEKQKNTLKKAREEAKVIVEKAREQAEKTKNSILTEAKRQQEHVVESMKLQLEQERKKMISEVKSEIGELVAMAAEKVVNKKIDTKKDAELIEESLK